MIPSLTIACLAISLFLLIALAFIDLRTRLLPNKYVLSFFLLGICFHLLTDFFFVSPLDSFLGALAGSGLLLCIRQIANAYYKKDTLGLGDVKLIGAAGIWLGMEIIFVAISTGAFFGLIHGLFVGLYTRYHKKENVSLAALSIPAGPGFIAGIVFAAFLKFETLPNFLLDFS